jgi:hypothetical protein
MNAKQDENRLVVIRYFSLICENSYHSYKSLSVCGPQVTKIKDKNVSDM